MKKIMNKWCWYSDLFSFRFCVWKEYYLIYFKDVKIKKEIGIWFVLIKIDDWLIVLIIGNKNMIGYFKFFK